MGAPQYEQAGADVAGTGTTDTIPRWTGASTLGDSPLTVSGSNVTGAGAIRATGTTASAPAFTGADTDTGVYFPAANQVRISTAGSLAVAVDASQNVGIGVIPNAWASSVRAEEMRTHARWNYNSGSDSVAYWTVNAFLNSAGNAIYKATAAASQYTQIGGAHVWERAVSGTAGNTVTWLESARIDSSGRLLVNTPTATAAVGARVTVANSSNAYISVNDTTANRGILLGVEGPKGIAYTAAGALGSESYVISYTFSTSGVQLGTTAAMVFDASGNQQGLKLRNAPNSTDPNTLDCYQEGTWTPTLAGFVTNTPGTIAASYTRVGRMVTLNVYLYAGGSSFGSTLGTTTVTVPSDMTPNFNGVGHGGLSRTTSSVAQVIAYYDGKIYLGTSASAVTEMWVSVTYFV